MMLHRHYETEPNENMTKLADVTPTAREEFVSDIFPPEEPVKAPKKRTRSKKDE